MIINLFSILYFLIISFTSINAYSDLNNNKTELIVEADKSLEWFEKENYYLAKGNVVVLKDDIKLKANKVIAKYDHVKGQNQLKYIIAEKNVSISKGLEIAKGDYMTYDVLQKKIIISGKLQTFSSNSGYIESNKELIYNNSKNKAEAIGNVKIILPNKTKISADNIKADFSGNSQSIKKAVANGNVIISSKNNKKISKADKGIYNASTDLITLKGNVVIISNGSKITGSLGETNIKSGISKILGEPNKSKRVKGTFSSLKK